MRTSNGKDLINKRELFDKHRADFQRLGRQPLISSAVGRIMNQIFGPLSSRCKDGVAYYSFLKAKGNSNTGPAKSNLNTGPLRRSNSNTGSVKCNGNTGNTVSICLLI